MKWSRYNYLFEADSKFFLYNSLTNSFAELELDTYKDLCELKQKESIDIQDSEIKEQLLAMKAIVEDDRDEINKIKFLAQRRRFNDKVLNLTINPTLHCNFACPYCFEDEHPNIYMTDEVEESIINYIKKCENAKFINVTWFGGEPLLAFDRIVSLTKKMQKLSLNYNAGMITNGYLFTEAIISQLPSLNIQTIQITIDGLAPLHDSRRRLRSGKGTFNKIMDNISLLNNIVPEIHVGIRVNIDKSNDEDFIKIYNIFKEKNYSNLSIHPAFVDDISGCKADDCIFNIDRKVEFIVKMQKEHNLDFSHFYPSSHRYECSVRNPYTIVIGPLGEIYKCWNDVGNKDQIVGYLNGEKKNENLLIRYLNGADPFDDPACKECILLPVCGGGCPYSRLKNEYEGTKISLCSLIKDNMVEFLLLHYQNQMKKM